MKKTFLVRMKKPSCAYTADVFYGFRDKRHFQVFYVQALPSKGWQKKCTDLVCTLSPLKTASSNLTSLLICQCYTPPWLAVNALVASHFCGSFGFIHWSCMFLGNFLTEKHTKLWTCMGTERVVLGYSLTLPQKKRSREKEGVLTNLPATTLVHVYSLFRLWWLFLSLKFNEKTALFLFTRWCILRSLMASHVGMFGHFPVLWWF